MELEEMYPDISQLCQSPMQYIGQKNDIAGKKTCFGLVLVGVFRMIQLEAMIMGTVATILCVGDDDFDD